MFSRNRTLRDGLIAAGIILAVVVVFTLSINALSLLIRNDAQQLYDFVTSAKRFHDKVGEANVINNIETINHRISHESFEDSSSIDIALRQGMLSARGYRDQLKWLYPTENTIELLESLFNESRLLERCYSRLFLAWSEKQAGDEQAYLQYLNESDLAYREFVSVRERNKATIINWLQEISSHPSN